ncbi:MAG TPA: hypothetical protein VE863_12345 [Pyrinomonadaceae bacterium]|nr:hypothetical protein [Pyrinomonadaceae bacterium]
MINRSALLLSIAFAVSAFALGQEPDKPMPDRWHGLIIDQSTPEDAVKALGQPANDKDDSFRPYPFDKRISTKGKTFRHLKFKDIKGLNYAELVFADNKLVSISLNFKEKIPATAIQNDYGVDFEPKIGGFESSSNPRDYERHEGKLYPKNYPPGYYLVATTERVWIGAAIDNSSFASMMLGSSRGSTGGGAFPGKAVSVIIVSRSLENREGSDVLK